MQIRTSVKVDENIFESFKISGIKYKISIQKLVERSMHLFINDPEFRKIIVNHTNLNLEK